MAIMEKTINLQLELTTFKKTACVCLVANLTSSNNQKTLGKSGGDN